MSALRIVLAVTGAVLAIAGLGTITSDAPGARLGGLVLVLLGGLLVLVAVLERTRYRSEDAERTADLPGPAGGEPLDRLEPRFQPTAEVFLDPTTRRRLRVYLDPRTGERRYVVEG